MSRLIIVSNRLPFSIDHEGDEVKLRQSSGGLVSAIKSYFENNRQQENITEKLWIGVADFPQEDWNYFAVNEAREFDFEIYRLLPDEWKKSLLQGLMGADVVGFHTYDYVQHFIQSVKMILGADTYFHTLQYQNRLIQVDLFPIGIDYKKFNNTANDPEVLRYKNEIEKNFDHKKIIFSVDRLDYTKGIMDRLNGFEFFLEQNTQRKENVIFILNVVPSRDEIQAYNERKGQ